MRYNEGGMQRMRGGGEHAQRSLLPGAEKADRASGAADLPGGEKKKGGKIMSEDKELKKRTRGKDRGARKKRTPEPEEPKVFRNLDYTAKMDERQKSLLALAEMKELEKKKHRKMRSVRVDERTVIAATPERLEELKTYYKIK